MKIFKSYYMSASIVPDQLALDETVLERTKNQVILQSFHENVNREKKANIFKRSWLKLYGNQYRQFYEDTLTIERVDKEPFLRGSLNNGMLFPTRYGCSTCQPSCNCRTVFGLCVARFPRVFCQHPPS